MPAASKRRQIPAKKQEIPVVTLSPDASPVASTSSSSDEPPPKRNKQVPDFIPPVPDAVEIPPVFDTTVRLDCRIDYAIYPQTNCNCQARMPSGMQIACRCFHGPPVPTVAVKGGERKFDLLDCKWLLKLDSLVPTAVVTQRMCFGVVFLPMDGELPGDAEIDVSGIVSLNGPTTFSGEKKFTYTLGIHKFKQRNQYYMPLDKTHISQLSIHPLGTPGCQYPSFVNFSLELKLIVVGSKNLKKPPRFTLDFERPKTLSNFVIMCGRRPLYANLEYLIHYSSYFECTARYVENGARHEESGFPMISVDAEDFEGWKAILLYLSPCRTPLRLDVLRICDQYALLTVKQEAETTLVNRLVSNKVDKHFSNLEYLTIAETYGLDQLKEHALNSLFRQISNQPNGINNFMQIIQTDKHYPNLQAASKVLILDRLRTFGNANPQPTPVNQCGSQ